MRREQWARAYLAVSAMLAALTFVLPRYHVVFWGALGLGSSAAVVVGTIVNRPARRWPWLLLALALAAFVGGDIAYDLLTHAFGLDNPFPSVADGFYLATYPLFAAGLLAMVRARRGRGDHGALLDALLVTTACALVSWLYLIGPYVRATDMTLFEKLISVAYPLGDVAILCVLARLLADGGRRNRSLYLLAFGAFGLLGADVAYGAIQLYGSWSVGGPTDLGWIIFYVSWGAAALHPSMVDLTARQPPPQRPLSSLTLFVLSAMTLVAPALLVWRTGNDSGDPDTVIIGSAAAVLFVLVMSRLTGMARAQSSQAERERALRASGEILVAASDMSAVTGAATEAVRAIIGPAVGACLIVESSGPWHRVVAGTPEDLIGGAVRIVGDEASSLTVERLGGEPLIPAGARARWRCTDLSADRAHGRKLLIAHLGPIPDGVANGLDALAAQLTLAAERVELAADLHLRHSEDRFRSLVQNASDVILVVPASGGLRAETPSVEAVLGYRPDELTGLSLAGLVADEDGPKAAALVESMLAGQWRGPVKADWRVRHRDGHLLDTEVFVNDLSGDAHIRGVVLTLRDVSERRALEGELRHQAFHDSLTTLANRLLFNDRVDHALSRRRSSPDQVGLLLIDVDDFKFVNDTLGHAAGDELLKQIAGRLVDCLRPQDTAARLGGDEFAVCIETEEGQHDLAGVAQRIIEAMRHPFQVNGSELNVRASIGLSVASVRTGTAADLLREADLALYAAKSRGKDSYYFFEPGLHLAVVQRLERRAALEQAIDAGELRLWYQPILALADRRLVGAEALVRWQHPSQGLVAPSEFVPLAEESGLIVHLGRWVLDRACADLAHWRREGGLEAGYPDRVTVNVSPRQLQSPDFLEVLDSAVARHRVPPEALTLEITESVFMQDSLDVVLRLSQLRERGVLLALDDFGTGYSSLSYLNRFPMHILKIDRSFVNGVDEDSERIAIISAISSLAAGLGLRVVAEGIETEAQAIRLLELGCEFGQGYHFGRPVPADQLLPRFSSTTR